MRKYIVLDMPSLIQDTDNPYTRKELLRIYKNLAFTCGLRLPKNHERYYRHMANQNRYRKTIQENTKTK